MNNDLKSNTIFIEGLAATGYAVGTHGSSDADMQIAPGAAFLVDVGDVGAAGTVDVTLQHSTDGETYINESVGDDWGNDANLPRFTAAGFGQMYVSQPKSRYYRAKVDVSEGDCDLGVVIALGPLRNVAAE